MKPRRLSARFSETLEELLPGSEGLGPFFVRVEASGFLGPFRLELRVRFVGRFRGLGV